MSPAAERLLAALADGYRVEVEDVGSWDADEWHLRKSIKFDGHLRDAARELYGLGLVDSSANGSGCCWINNAGRAACAPVGRMQVAGVALEYGLEQARRLQSELWTARREDLERWVANVIAALEAATESVDVPPKRQIPSGHVCGLEGYNQMIDPPCPACVANRTDRQPKVGDPT